MIGMTFPRKSGHRLRGFRLCLLWGDVADGGVDAPPIVIAFDIGEQVAPRGIAIGVFAVVDELGFQSAEETLHWRIVPAVSLAAHRLDDSGGLQDVAVVAGGAELSEPELLADEIFLLCEGARVSMQSVGREGPAKRLPEMLQRLIANHTKPRR